MTVISKNLISPLTMERTHVIKKSIPRQLICDCDEYDVADECAFVCNMLSTKLSAKLSTKLSTNTKKVKNKTKKKRQ